MSPEKIKIFDAIDALSGELCDMSDRIFDFSEISGEEYQSSALLEDYLEAHGFCVERGIAGLPTAFRAVYRNGEGGLKIGLLAEYDALEGMGHGCGHHMQGPSIAGVAVALKEAGLDTPFELVVYGTPAEETLGGKIVMMEQGCFQDIDVAFMMHGGPETCTDVKCMALENFRVTFHGKASHAAIAPDQGRSAFDAALLSFHALEMLREHVKDDTRMHYTVNNAGGPPNVVPEIAEAEYTLRSYSTDYLNEVVERFMDILKGACLMTGTTCEIQRDRPFKSKVPCALINEVLMENARLADAPTIRPPREKTGSTDFGNVMYEIPGSCIRIAFVPEGSPAHSMAYVNAGKSQEAHRAVVKAAQILAGSCLDLIKKPELFAQIRQEFLQNKGK